MIDARVEKQGSQSRPSDQRWRAARTITADTRVEKEETQSQASNQRWRAVRAIIAASIQQKAAESMERRLEGEVQEDAVLISPKKPRIGLTEEEIRALGRAMKQEVTGGYIQIVSVGRYH